MSGTARIRTGDLTSKRETGPVGRPGLLAAGGLLAALGASSCCIFPLVLFSVGVSGAWIGNLTALAPYQPYFLAAALALLGAGFVQSYRRAPACSHELSCATPASTRVAKVGLWAATALVLAAMAFPYTARLFLDL